MKFLYHLRKQELLLNDTAPYCGKSNLIARLETFGTTYFLTVEQKSCLFKKKNGDENSFPKIHLSSLLSTGFT
jgi:hypothetical protein